MKKMPFLSVFIVILQSLGMYLVMLDRWRGWYGYHIAYSLEQKPYVFRVLIPFLSRTLEKLTSIDAVYCMGLLFVLSAVGFLYSAKYLCDFYGKDSRYAFYSFQALFLLCIVETKVYDYATAMFFVLSVSLIVREKHGCLLLLFPLATLNRETTFLISVFYFVYNIKKLDKIWFNLVLQATVFLLIKFYIQLLFRGNGGQEIYFDLWNTILIYANNWFFLLPIIPLTYVLSIKNDKTGFAFLTVFAIQVVLHLLFGKAFEVRVFVETVSMLLFVTSPLSQVS